MDGGDIRGLSHVVVEVTDLDAAEAFYRDMLGCTSIGRDAWADAGGNAVLRAGDAVIVLARNAAKTDLGETGTHQAYRISPAAREAARRRLAAEGFTVETYREYRPAEADDNFYVSDPSGNRVQLVADAAANGASGITGIDHACVLDYDMQSVEAFYGDIIGLPVEYVTGLRTEDYVHATEWADGARPMAPGSCRMVRYYREIPGQNRMQPRPTLQTYFQAGTAVVGVYMAMDDYAEPPEEQCVGTPRLGIAVARGKLDAIAARLEAKRHVFRGPVDHGANAPLPRSLYARDTGGNFIEFCEI